jgi:hypothetical protein
MALYKAIDVWKRVDATSAVRYRCFENLASGTFSVQSADWYWLPFKEPRLVSGDGQLIELLIEQAPDERSESFDTIEAAIFAFEEDFSK